MKPKIGRISKIPLTRPYFDKAEEREVVKVIRSGWVTQGPKVAELEEAVKEYAGAKYPVATSSATTALFLSLYVLDIGPGDEVLVPSFSFIATANVVVHVGAKPVFVDIDPRTYNIDPAEIEKKITAKTKAILPADQVGLACDLNRISAIARKHKIYVIEDAACALGSLYKGKKIGTLADIACFSFHPRKNVTTGEGGMILTQNKKWAERLKRLRQHGMSISDVARHEAGMVIHEDYPEVGFNFRMSDLEAAVGVAQMKKLPSILEKRRLLADRYTQAFRESRDIIPPYVPPGYVHNWQSYVIRLKRNSKVTRDELMQKLLDHGIATRRGVMASHLELPYKKMFGNLKLPRTEAATRETLVLPLYPQMTEKEQDRVIDRILQVSQKGIR